MRFQNQIEELKRAQNPSTAHLRDILLDPAINLMFQRMKKEMDVCKDKLEQAQNDLAAWKFTADGYGLGEDVKRNIQRFIGSLNCMLL